MVRKLFLIRHGEAEEGGRDLKDFDRQLTRLGYQHAAHIGNYLSKENMPINLIISSTATRANQTAETIADHIKYDYERIRFEEDLYEASVRILLKAINELPGGSENIAIVAHNPSISYLAEYLSGESIGNMVPAGLCILSFKDLEWSAVSQNSGSIAAIISPENLNYDL